MNLFRKRSVVDFKGVTEGSGLKRKLTAFDIAALATMFPVSGST